MAFVTLWSCVSLSIILAFLVRSGKDTFINDFGNVTSAGCSVRSRQTYSLVLDFFLLL